jgi:heme/copper-type cytochrome/quinol oxidase subunit 4
LWNTLLFLFMLAIMLIVVVGSVYIMYNLNYHMM